MALFDTQAMVSRLEAGNFTHDQALALVDAMKVTADTARNELVTVGKFEQGISELKHELKIDMKDLKSDLSRWIVGLFLAQTTALAGLVLALAKLR